MSDKNNLEYYEYFRVVPENAKKPITGGRLNGMTDINPMWRIKVLTEMFGACGEGWYYEVIDKKIYPMPIAEDPKEVVATVDINLYVKYGDEWSKPIFGTGGSMLLSQERKGAYVNDEAFKMALTDAISVACKALGVGADVYWGSDNTKYNDSKRKNKNKAKEPEEEEPLVDLDAQISSVECKTLRGYLKKLDSPESGVCEYYKVADISALTKGQYGELMATLMKREQEK